MSELVSVIPDSVLGNFAEINGAETIDIVRLLASFWSELAQARDDGQKPNQLRATFDRNLAKCMAVWQTKTELCLKEHGLTVEAILANGCNARTELADRSVHVVARPGSFQDFIISYLAPGERSSLKYTPKVRFMVATQVMESYTVDPSGHPTGRYYVTFGDERNISIGKQNYIEDNEGCFLKEEHIQFNRQLPGIDKL